MGFGLSIWPALASFSFVLVCGMFGIIAKFSFYDLNDISTT
jgi:hypothetical protein